MNTQNEEISNLLEECQEMVAKATVASSSVSRQRDLLTSIRPDELNRIALAQHHLLQKPHDALRIHLIAIEMQLCGDSDVRHFHTHKAFPPLGNRDREEDKEQEQCAQTGLLLQQRQVSFDNVVALSDIGSCYWSIGYFEESSKMYFAALSIYHLMKLDLPFIVISIYNRLNILYPHMKSADINTQIESIISSHQSHDDPFNKGMDITKSAISNVTLQKKNDNSSMKTPRM